MQDTTSPDTGPQATAGANGHVTTPQPGTSRYATVKEAADLLGVSTETIRRMIKAGKLQAERVHRPQGSAFVVLLDDAAALTSQEVTGDATLGRHQVTHRPAASPALLAAEAWAHGVVEPLTRVIDDQRRELEAKAERIGYLAAELDQVRARLAELESPAESARLEEIARENGVLVERLATQKRLRDAAMAHAAELEQRLESVTARAAAAVPDPFPAPIPPTLNVGDADDVAALRAEHGRHTADLERADAMLSRQAASHARLSQQARWLWIVLAVVVTVGTLGLLAPTWVR